MMENTKYLLKLLLILLTMKTANQGYSFSKSPAGFHDYSIDQSQISNTCQKFDIKEFTMSYFYIAEKQTEFKEKYVDTENDLMEEYIENPDEQIFEKIKQKASSKIWYFYGMTLFSIIFTLIATFYLVMRVCKRGIRKIKKFRARRGGVTLSSKKRNRHYSNPCLTLVNTKRCRLLLYIFNIIVAAFIIFALFKWRKVALEAVEGLKKTDCSMSRYYSSTLDGMVLEYKSGNYLKFLGINGVIHFLKKLQSEVLNVESLGNKYSKFKENSIELYSYTDKFRRKYMGMTVPSPTNSSFGITPNITQEIQQGLKVDDFLGITEEYFVLGASIMNGEYISKWISTDKLAYFSAVEELKEEMLDAKWGVESAKKETEKFNYKTRGPLFLLYINGITFGFLIGIILFACAFTLSHCFRKILKPSICFQATFTLLVLYGTVITEIFAIVSYRRSYLWAKMCAYSDELKSNERIAEKYLPTASLKFVRQCYFENSTGLLYNILQNDNKFKIAEILTLVKSATIDTSKYSQVNDPDDLSLLSSIEGFRKRLKKLQNYEELHFTQTKTIEDLNHPFSAIKNINTDLVCTNNEVQLKSENCTKSPVSSLSDAKEYKNSEDYCLVPNYFSHLDIDGRYTSTCLDIESPNVEKKVKDFLEFNDKYQKLLKDMDDEIGLNIYPAAMKAGEQMITENNAREYPQTVTEKIKYSSEFYVKSEFEISSNCKNTNVYLDEFIGNLCFNFIYNFREQAILIMKVTPLLFLFSCVNFFAILGARTKLIDEDLYGLGAVRSSTNFTPNKVERNVEDAPREWGDKITANRTNSGHNGGIQMMKIKKSEPDLDDGFNQDDEEKKNEVGDDVILESFEEEKIREIGIKNESLTKDKENNEISHSEVERMIAADSNRKKKRSGKLPKMKKNEMFNFEEN